MKSRVLIIPLLLFGIVLAGCSGGSDTAAMRELAGIDSLLSKARQYELAQQRLDSLHTEGFNQSERAYYSLLLTQSHYKNYINDTTDAVINEAVNYYKHHDEPEKYTRSLLYQGCVYEIMGDAEKAITSYKDAENEAQDNDLENKAFAKLRLATLYADNSNYADLKIRKYKEALDLYNQLGDKHYQIVCLTDIGGYYRNQSGSLDSAHYYIDKAISLSEAEHEDWFLFQNLYHRAEMYCLITKEYDKAKVDILKALEAGKDEIDHPRAHYVAAETYLNLGRPDSALYYLNHVPASGMMSNHTSDTVMYCRLMSEIAELKRVRSESRTRGVIMLAALLALVAMAVAFLAWRYRNRLKQKEMEYELLRADLDSSLSSLEQMKVTISNRERELQAVQDQLRGNDARMGEELAALEARQRKDDEMRSIVDNQIQVIHQLLELSYQPNETNFTRKFNEVMTLPVEGAIPTDSYWNNLHSLTNDMRHGVLDEAQRIAGGTLSESEMNFLALYCYGFSRTVIMICMKYSSLGTVSNKKIQIAKKLGVNNLDDFVNNYR